MSELKTLKDFEIPDVAVEGVIKGIRSEAIKWIKEEREIFMGIKVNREQLERWKKKQK